MSTRHSTARDCAHGQLALAREAELPHDEDVERRFEPLAAATSSTHPSADVTATRQGQHEHVLPAPGDLLLGQPFAELAAGLSTVAEPTHGLSRERRHDGFAYELDHLRVAVHEVLEVNPLMPASPKARSRSTTSSGRPATHRSRRSSRTASGSSSPEPKTSSTPRTRSSTCARSSPTTHVAMSVSGSVAAFLGAPAYSTRLDQHRPPLAAIVDRRDERVVLVGEPDCERDRPRLGVAAEDERRTWLLQRPGQYWRTRQSPGSLTCRRSPTPRVHRRWTIPQFSSSSAMRVPSDGSSKPYAACSPSFNPAPSPKLQAASPPSGSIGPPTSQAPKGRRT